MRSLLVRVAAVIAVAFGAAFAAQGVALADDQDVSVTADADVTIDTAPVYVNIAIVAVLALDLDDIPLLDILSDEG